MTIFCLEKTWQDAKIRKMVIYCVANILNGIYNHMFIRRLNFFTPRELNSFLDPHDPQLFFYIENAIILILSFWFWNDVPENT